MSASNKAKDKAQAVKGEGKKAVGKAVGSPRLEAESQADQVQGNLKQAAEKIKGRRQEVTCFTGQGDRRQGRSLPGPAVGYLLAAVLRRLAADVACSATFRQCIQRR